MSKYTLKDIIFSLRHAYIDNQIEMNKLKSYIEVTDPKIEEYDFYTYYSQKRNYYVLLCDLERKQSAISKFFEKLSAPKKSVVNLTKKKDNNFYFEIEKDGRPSNKAKIISERTSEFKEKALDILQDKFVKEMNIHRYYDDSKKFELDISPNRISAGVYPNGIIQPASFFYRAQLDMIEILAYYDYFFIEDASTLLNIEIPEEELNEYIIDIINKYNAPKKDIVISGLTQDRTSQYFAIYEKDNEIILKRRK